MAFNSLQWDACLEAVTGATASQTVGGVAKSAQVRPLQEETELGPEGWGRDYKARGGKEGQQ